MNVEIKVLEIRDRMTSIPWLAFRFAPGDPRERELLGRVGFYPAEDYVIQGRAQTCELSYDAFQAATNERTRVAAVYIRDHFEELASGAVVDVRAILGEPIEADR